MNYVLGLAYYKNTILLVQKNKGPKGIIGKWNGIGGKIEEDAPYYEHPGAAMVREFKEETGIPTTQNDWEYVTTVHGPDKKYQIVVYKTHLKDDHLDQIHFDMRNDVGEYLSYKRYDDLMNDNFADIMRFLIPLSFYNLAYEKIGANHIYLKD